MNVMQLSVFIENHPGHLQNVLKILGEASINIITLTIAETSDFGILRVICNKPDEALAILKKEHVICSATDVLAIEIEDKPGELCRAVTIFAQQGLNIEYMYAFTEKREGKAVMIFRFDDIEVAKEALSSQGYRIVKKIEIIGE
ncbi:MAG: ACT domain-containing protein [Spirochaetes bacterium]|nr:ACT domain-containing protein [Spirochaetota bacterium]